MAYTSLRGEMADVTVGKNVCAVARGAPSGDIRGAARSVLHRCRAGPCADESGAYQALFKRADRPLSNRHLQAVYGTTYRAVYGLILGAAREWAQDLPEQMERTQMRLARRGAIHRVAMWREKSYPVSLICSVPDPRHTRAAAERPKPSLGSVPWEGLCSAHPANLENEGAL